MEKESQKLDMPPMSGQLSPIETLTLVCHCISSSCEGASNLPSYLLPQCPFKTSRSWGPRAARPCMHTHTPLPPPLQSIWGYCCRADKPKQRALKLYSVNQYIMWRFDKARLPALLSLLHDPSLNPQNCSINITAATVIQPQSLVLHSLNES